MRSEKKASQRPTQLSVNYTEKENIQFKCEGFYKKERNKEEEQEKKNRRKEKEKEKEIQKGKEMEKEKKYTLKKVSNSSQSEKR